MTDHDPGIEGVPRDAAINRILAAFNRVHDAHQQSVEEHQRSAARSEAAMKAAAEQFGQHFRAGGDAMRAEARKILLARDRADVRRITLTGLCAAGWLFAGIAIPVLIASWIFGAPTISFDLKPTECYSGIETVNDRPYCWLGPEPLRPSN